MVRMNISFLFKQIFCKHEFKTLGRDRYSVNRINGEKEGEVTLILLECKKCNKNKLIPIDRTHEVVSV